MKKLRVRTVSNLSKGHNWDSNPGSQAPESMLHDVCVLFLSLGPRRDYVPQPPCYEVWPLSSEQWNVSKGDEHYGQDWPIKPFRVCPVLSLPSTVWVGKIPTTWKQQSSPISEPLRPSEKGTTTSRKTHKEGSLTGRQPRWAVPLGNASLFPGNPNPWLSMVVAQVLTISGQHQTRPWAISETLWSGYDFLRAAPLMESLPFTGVRSAQQNKDLLCLSLIPLRLFFHRCSSQCTSNSV